MTAFEVAAGGLGLAWLLGPVTAAMPGIFAYLRDAALNLVLTRHVFSNDEATHQVLNQFLRECEVVWEGHSNSVKGFEVFNYYITPLKKRRAIWVSYTENRWKILKYRDTYIIYLPHLFGTDSDRGHLPSLIYRRGSVDIKKLLRECEDKNAEVNPEEDAKRFKIVDVFTSHTKAVYGISKASDDPPNPYDVSVTSTAVPVNWSIDDIGVDVEASETEDLATNPAMEEVFRAVRFWHRRKDWHREVGLPHRVGIGGFGPPGTGKTSAIRAIASELDLPVYRYHLAGMTDQEFAEKWREARDQSKGSRVALFEDFDTVFDLRQPAAGVEITYSDFLNTIDGIERDEGVLLYVTANDPSKIDPALGVLTAERKSTRPGRLSVVVEFPAVVDEAGRRKIAARILRGEPAEDVDAVVVAGSEDSPDQFTHRCVERMREVMMQAYERGATE